MWSLLKKNNEECRKTQDGLEEIAERRLHANSVEELVKELPAEGRAHIAACSLCREAADDLIVARNLFRGVTGQAGVERPFFAARVMAAIVSRERELAKRMSAWSEVPRFASRLALVSALLLLAGTTWLYEKAVKTPSNLSNGAAQESIFEPTQQTNQDDLLISMAESNP